MRSRYLILMLALAGLSSAFAQESPGDLAPVEFKNFEKGDGLFSINLGTSVPLGFWDSTASGFVAPNADLGFAFSLSYIGLLDAHWAIGGDLGGSFITTLADRRLFIAPIDFRVAYFFNLSPFTIAPSVGFGMAISSLSEYKHVDPLVRLGSSFYWRVNADMSYGFNLFGNIIPQFYEDSTQNMVGFFLEATLSLAYNL
ncbi:MAG: hypothetical protein E4H20_01870 [Spirochaetales bacterium]|nr:MAG: hypothetical protein E4H20_01870 [Spirochaetales bacterium]